MGWDQTLQDRIRRGYTNLARRIFMWRVRYYVMRGKVRGARIVQGGDDG